ncbi:SusC/RagA family TonB-linked outer membrane protein [Parapedobacter lycopersici]|uniref:SusC/RagA family TonB-linked outer membrane protein n=1 Tax=Parapedobacter lycopersici TaxID=1864939 RepID=UPI00214D1DA0|nr:SusC/RagA family TonB-linked outer membrane protein [Parapedobacter lycopersici]
MIVNLATVLMICTLVQVSAKGFSQISIHKKDASLGDIIESIEAQTNYVFLSKDYDLSRRGIDIDITDASLETTLDACFKNLPLTYKVIDKTVVIRRAERRLENRYTPAAEAIDIRGQVTNSKGEPLVGVSVKLKGTSAGTTTGEDGKYVLTVPNGDGILAFSYIGYVSQETAIAGRNIISIQLAEDANALSEVVVTALGISREKKALAYSVTEVKGEEFTQAREMNIANALTGKIAGVNATGMATGAGGSSRIIIRGNGSLNGNNMPLYIVNGMPIDNSIPGGAATRSGAKINVDRGDGIAGINPDDIETISVLKGGAASALYGSRASNGVILITTKKGVARKGIGVEFNSSSTFESINVFPDFQYEYGQGVDGKKPMTQAEALNSGHTSFGAKMDGEPYVQFDGVERPYAPVYVKDNLKAVYRTGSNYANTVAFTGGNESLNYRFSLSNTDAFNIQPNSSFNRKTGNLNVNSTLGKRLTVQAVAQYNIEKAKNRPKIGYEDVNASWVTQVIANTVDIRNLAPGYDEEGKEIQWGPWAESTNVYFTLNKFINHDNKNRFIGQANIQYDLTDNLYIKGTVGQDYYNFNYVAISPTNLAFRPLGDYESIESAVSETNGMLTLNYNSRVFNDALGIIGMLGANKQRSSYVETRIKGQDFIIPYFYSYTNLNILNTIPTDNQSSISSVFGSLDFDYKGIAYLTLTGRQDWFSTLSAANNSIFYPSIGGSFLLSQAMELPAVFNLLKLRGSWAQVGGATVDPYRINQTYGLLQGGHNGRPVQTLGLIPNPDLRPLVSTTYEVGFETQLLNNRLGVDFTYYDRKTTDDIVETQVSSTSGMTSTLLNIGELSNKGIELLITATPVSTANFNWNVSYNAAYNKSEIVKLAPGLNDREIGKPYNTIWGYDKLVNENGESVYDAKSGYAAKTDLLDLGVGVPPLTMGFTTDFAYKNFSLNILFDGKFGNTIWSRFSQYTHRFGLQKRTLPGRENGLTLSGVDREGNPFTKTWTVAELDSYYDYDKNYDRLFVYDGSFVKLRQVILGYHLPVDKLGLSKLTSASVSLVARNLLTLYSKTDGFDPESNNLVTNDQGYESFGVPRTRTIGVNLMVKF